MDTEPTDHYSEYCGKGFRIISVLAALAFWAVFTCYLTKFVPAQSASMMWIFAAFTAFSMTGVFFIALNMFWLVAVEHRRARLR